MSHNSLHWLFTANFNQFRYPKGADKQQREKCIPRYISGYNIAT